MVQEWVVTFQSMLWYGIINATLFHMMTSSNGNIFRITDPLCGEFTNHRWIPLTKANDTELWCFSLICALNKRLSKQSYGWWVETPSRSLWRHLMIIPRQANSCGTYWSLPNRQSLWLTATWSDWASTTSWYMHQHTLRVKWPFWLTENSISEYCAITWQRKEMGSHIYIYRSQI